MAFIRTGDAGREQIDRVPAKSNDYLVLADFAAVLAVAFACFAEALAAAFRCLAAAFASLAGAVAVLLSVLAGVVPATAGAARTLSTAKEAMRMRFIIPSPGNSAQDRAVLLPRRGVFTVR